MFVIQKSDTMKRVVLVVMLSILSLDAMAQNGGREVRRIEIEPSISWQPALAIEGRYNFNRRPWDVGINAALDLYGPRITTVGDYNFSRNKKCALFVGAGAGWANTDILNIDEAIELYGDACCAPDQDCLCVYPRVGVELFRHLRITLSLYTYNFRACVPSLSVGVAICGGNKK